MPDAQTTSPSGRWNWTYHVLGALALAANKVRYYYFGYRRARDFDPDQIDRCVQYDSGVVDNWLAYLNAYLGRPAEIDGKNILELGPGQDLGIGLILLARGARKYNAVDAHDLLSQSSEKFYKALFDRLESDGLDESSLADLRGQLGRIYSDRADRLNYLWREDFDLSVLDGEGVDFVFSQAAFEHFDDAARTVGQLSSVVNPGAVFLAVIDLQTHTRRLRDLDPLNIYRYSDFYYRLCRYVSQPNRLRPAEYREILADNGWGNIQIKPLSVLDSDYLRKVQPYLNERFRADDSQMEYLTIVICATKK
jgi:SAM-dependent methyltransferase